MKLYLHIGTAKTGSTSIQSFLTEETERLAASGILFPEPGRRFNHLLPLFVAENKRFLNLRRTLGIGTLQEGQARAETVLSRLDRQIAEAPSSTRAVVLSSEHLSGLSVREVARLSGLLRPRFSVIECIVYLREQSAYLTSMQNTALKTGSLNAKPHLPKEVSDLDYQKLLTRWAESDLCDKMTVRLFERDALAGGDVVLDFMECLDIDQEGFLPTPDANPSFDLLALELMPYINKQLLRFTSDGRPNPERGNIARVLEGFLTRGAKATPPQQLVVDCQAAYGASNEWVRKTWFPDRTALFTAKDYTETKHLNIPPEYLQEMADLIVALWQKVDRKAL